MGVGGAEDVDFVGKVGVRCWGSKEGCRIDAFFWGSGCAVGMLCISKGDGFNGSAFDTCWLQLDEL